MREVTITTVFRVVVPDGTDIQSLYLDIDRKLMSVRSTEGYKVDATIEGYETVGAVDTTEKD